MKPRRVRPAMLLLGALLWAGPARLTQNGNPPLNPPPAAATSAEIHPAPQGFRFPDGETLVYQGDWRLWTAGTATIQITRNGNQEHVHGTADSSGALGLLYHVHDRYDAYFDAETLCSSRIFKHTEELLHRKDTQITFDYARGQAVLEETNLRNNQRKRAEFAIPGCATDVLSDFFYVSTLPLAAGEAYFFPLNDGNKTVDVTLQVEAREDVKTPAGAFHTVRVQPRSSNAALKDRGRILVWYTDDAQHIPVQMRAQMLWGTLTIHLLRIEHPPASADRSAD